MSLCVIYSHIQRHHREQVPKTDPTHLFTIRLVQNCAAILATAELLGQTITFRVVSNVFN